MPEFTIIDRVLSMSRTIHSARSLYKLRVLIERWAYSEPFQRSNIERFGKIIVAFNYFRETPRLKSLRGF